MKLPLITEVARGSSVDGPGLRTVVFFKGCTMRCAWCHNPETWKREQEIFFHPDACIRCGECLKVCQNGAIDLGRNEIIVRENCIRCGNCADACDSLALQKAGKTYEWEKLREIILRDTTYYEVSGGGVTFSGGEPLMHIDFLKPLVRALKKEGLHIAFETAGNFFFDQFEKGILPWTDLILFDIKVACNEAHRKATGVSNQLIRENLEKLVVRKDVLVVPRIPLVPGFTATQENLLELGSWLNSLGFQRCDLVSYNPSMFRKWRKLGKKAPVGLAEGACSLAEEKELASWFYEQFPALKPKGPLYFKESIPV